MMKTTSTKIHQNPPKNYICKFCNNNFTRSDSLNRHYNRCKLKKESESLILYQNEEILEMQDKIKKLEDEIKNNKENIQNNTNITTNNFKKSRVRK